MENKTLSNLPGELFILFFVHSRAVKVTVHNSSGAHLTRLWKDKKELERIYVLVPFIFCSVHVPFQMLSSYLMLSGRKTTIKGS